MFNPQFSRTRSRVLASVSLLAVLSLSACSFGEPRDVAIPKALLASDLGISAVRTFDKTDGFTLTAGVAVELTDDTFTSEDMPILLELVAENVNTTSVDKLEIYATVGPYEDHKRVDLAAFGAELGFPRETYPTGSPTVFVAYLDDVAAFLDD